MTENQESFFRPEVVEERKNRLHGEVVIKQTASSKLMALVLVAVILVGAIWLAVGEYSRTEQAQGILVTTKPSAKVFAARPGVVTKLNVTEGAEVVVGDVLAVVNLDQRDDNGSANAETVLGTIEARKQLAQQEIDTMRSRASNDQRRLEAEIASNLQQIQGVQAQLRIQREIHSSHKKLFESMRDVFDRGFVSQVDYERRKQNVLNSEQELSRLKQQLVSLEGANNRYRSEITSTTFKLSQEVSSASSSIENLLQQRALMQGERAYIVTAPISGRVAVLRTATGRFALIDRPLLTIVPQESALKAQIYAPTRAIGFVKPGHEVRLLYDAFPYQRFGSYSGKVSEISRTILDPREADIPFQLEEPVYQVTVEIDRQSISGYGEEVPLQPGMTLTANLVLERQSFVDWLLTPVRAVLNRS